MKEYAFWAEENGEEKFFYILAREPMEAVNRFVKFHPEAKIREMTDANA